MANILQPVLNNVSRLWRDLGDGSYAPVVAPQEPPLFRDAFHRQRVSNPEYGFDAQLTYDLHPLLFEQITAQSGASVAHDTTNRCALLTFSSTPTGGQAIMQTFEHFRYQPGRSHYVFITFNFIEAVANVVKFAGYSAGPTNGIELQLTAAGPQVVLYSDTTVGDRTFTPSSEEWTDPLDGTGKSGKTVDWTKTQILGLDLQALYVGEIRLALDIDGTPVEFCDIRNANRQAYPYIQTANLPIRCGMTCTGTVSTTMRFICCSLMSEGGTPFPLGYGHYAEGAVTAGNGTRTHCVSVRPKTTFNSIGNRVKFELESVDLLVTGNNPVKWELCIGQALTAPSYSDVNATYSAFEAVSGATLSGNPAEVFAAGYIAASNQAKQSISREAKIRKPICLNAAGAVSDLRTLTLLVTGIGAASACRGIVNWREIR